MALFALVSAFAGTIGAQASSVSSPIPVSSTSFKVIVTPGVAINITGVNNTLIKVYAPENGVLRLDGSSWLQFPNKEQVVFFGKQVKFLAHNGSVSKGQLLIEANSVTMGSFNSSLGVLTNINLLWNGQLINAFASNGKTFTVPVDHVVLVSRATTQILRNHAHVWQLVNTYRVYYKDGSSKIVMYATDLIRGKCMLVTNNVQGRAFETRIVPKNPASAGWWFYNLGPVSK